MPKVSSRPCFVFAENTIAELQSGQKVATMGSPLIRSFTISCHMRKRRGYARSLPPIFTESTGSCGLMFLSSLLPSLTETIRGAFMAGIPSLGGPPLIISANGTECRAKLVFGNSACQARGGFSACADKFRAGNKNARRTTNRKNPDLKTKDITT